MKFERLSLPVFQILHHHIATVEKLPLTTTGCPLLIHCKNFRVAHFVIGHERDCHEVYTSLLKLSQPGECESVLKSVIVISWQVCFCSKGSYYQAVGFPQLGLEGMIWKCKLISLLPAALCATAVCCVKFWPLNKATGLQANTFCVNKGAGKVLRKELSGPVEQLHRLLHSLGILFCLLLQGLQNHTWNFSLNPLLSSGIPE